MIVAFFPPMNCFKENDWRDGFWRLRSWSLDVTWERFSAICKDLRPLTASC